MFNKSYKYLKKNAFVYETLSRLPENMLLIFFLSPSPFSLYRQGSYIAKYTNINYFLLESYTNEKDFNIL